MATVEVLLSKSREACQWMVQYLVGQEGREITRSVLCQSINQSIKHLISSIVTKGRMTQTSNNIKIFSSWAGPRD